MIHGRIVLLSLAAMLFFSGCVSSVPQGQQEAANLKGRPGAAVANEWFSDDVKWDTSGDYSKVLIPGPFKVLPVEVATFASFDGVKIQTAAWRPDVPAGTKVPIILDVGPYYGDSIHEALGYIADPILEGLVPHGFAWVQMAIRGTAGSGGCSEFFGLKEQKDIDAAVTHFGTQEWSNGNVGLIGISYDGTTTWISAQFGNPHLKTIVPIAGLTSIYDHGVRNGTAWGFTPIIHTHYWNFGFQTQSRTPQDKAANVACPEEARGAGTAITTTLTGDREELAPFDGYWSERDFKPKIKENYQGSVFMVNGLLDWRVPPYLQFPLMNELDAKGLDTKMLLGQWWHAMPDGVTGSQQRWDWAETLLRWFTHYLYEDESVATGPKVDVQDDSGAWRNEEVWPPVDAAWTTFHLGQGVIRPESPAAGEQVLWGPGSAHAVATERLPQGRGSSSAPIVEYRASSGPLTSDLRFSGLPRLHVTFVPTSPEGSRIMAELYDRSPNGAERFVGVAVMDLRYYEGGYAKHSLTPNAPILAKMEFQPLDSVISAGHELVLVISNTGYSGERVGHDTTGVIDQYHEGPTPLPVRIVWGDGKSTLQLPIIDRDVGAGAYPGQTI